MQSVADWKTTRGESTTSTVAPSTGLVPVGQWKTNRPVASTLPTLRAQAETAKATADEAGSFGGLAKETLAGVGRFVPTLVTGILDMYRNPDPVTKQTEDYYTIKPTGNKIYDTVTAPVRAVSNTLAKGVIRTASPGLVPYAQDVGQSIHAGEILEKIKTGELPSEALNNLDVLEKTTGQMFGDILQVALTVGTPSYAGRAISVTKFSSGLRNALATGTLHGTQAGAAFGIAQALSSGSSDASEIAEIITANVAGGALLGLITSGAIKVSEPMLRKAQDVANVLKSKSTPLPPDGGASGTPQMSVSEWKTAGKPQSADLTSSGTSSGDNATASIKSPPVNVSETLRNAEVDLSNNSTKNLPSLIEDLKISPDSAKNLIPEDVPAIRELYANLPQKASSFVDIYQKGLDAGGRAPVSTDSSFARPFSVKSFRSLVDKVGRKRMLRPYSTKDIGDFVRGDIMADSPEQALKILDAYKGDIVEGSVGEHFNTPNDWGYRGINLNVKLADGTHAEIQVHTPSSMKIKDALHDSYTEWRSVAVENIPANVITDIAKRADAIWHGEMAGKASSELATQGGSTLGYRTWDSPKKGYTYSPDKSTETRILEAEYTDADYIAFTEKYKEELKKDANYVGVYRDSDTGDIVLDVSRNTDKLREAINGAKNSDQDSIYDVENNDLIKREEYETAYSTNQSPRQNPSTSSGRGEEGVGGEQKVEPTAGAPKPVSTTNSELSSRVFERMKAENPSLEGDLNYNPIKLKEDADRAVALIEKDKQKAFNIAMGAETSPDVTSTAVNIALAEKALAEGNTALYARLIKNRSLEQTRRGQELVAERGSVTDNSTAKYVKELIASRLDALGKHYLSDLTNAVVRATDKKKATKIIDREVAKLQTQIKNKKLDTKTALSLLDKLTCV